MGHVASACSARVKGDHLAIRVTFTGTRDVMVHVRAMRRLRGGAVRQQHRQNSREFTLPLITATREPTFAASIRHPPGTTPSRPLRCSALLPDMGIS
jgi:hypothetical protein